MKKRFLAVLCLLICLALLPVLASGDEKAANTFTLSVGGESYDIAPESVEYNKDEGKLFVTATLYDFDVMSYISGGKMNLPFGCGLIGTKDGFIYQDGGPFTFTLSEPISFTWKFDTKNIPELICFGKLNQKDYAASEDFALVDGESLDYVCTFPVSEVTGSSNSEIVEAAIDAGNQEPEVPAEEESAEETVYSSMDEALAAAIAEAEAAARAEAEALVNDPEYLAQLQAEAEAQARAEAEAQGHTVTNVTVSKPVITDVKVTDVKVTGVKVTAVDGVPVEELADVPEELLTEEPVTEEVAAEEAAEEEAPEEEPAETKPLAEGEYTTYADYLAATGDTFLSLFNAADEALAGGLNSQEVYDGMVAAAEQNGWSEAFFWAAENIAAQDNPTDNMIRNKLGDNRSLDLDINLDGDVLFDSGLLYGAPEVSNATREMLKDDAAQYPVDPKFWQEKEFKSLLGAEFKKFKPSRPRAGYATLVLSAKSQESPTLLWSDGADDGNLFSAMADTINAACIELGTDAPVFTANPKLASTFWVFDMQYSSKGKYTGGDGSSYEGFNLAIKVTVMDAVTHKNIAEISTKAVLANSLSGWDHLSFGKNGKYLAPFTPSLQEEAKYPDFIKKVSAHMQKNRSTASLGIAITPRNATTVLKATLLNTAAGVKDGWAKAILESEPQDVKLTEDMLTFTLCTFDLDMDHMGAYENHMDDGWLSEAFFTCRDSRAEFSLPIAEGQPTAKGLTALKKDVGTYAKAALKTWNTKEMTQAFIDRYFPTPVEGKPKSAAEVETATRTEAFNYYCKSTGYLCTPDTESLLPLMYGAGKKTVNFKGGPHDIRIAVTGINPEKILENAAATVLQDVAYLKVDKRPETEEIGSNFYSAVLEEAFTAAKKPTEKLSISVDLTSENESREYTDYIYRYDYVNVLTELLGNINDLPDKAAMEMPESGIISGTSKGTSVTFKCGDNLGRYIQVQTKSGSPVMSLFVNPAKRSVTVRIPKGSYNMLVAAGTTWYGEDDLFGEGGSYSLSEEMDVPSTNYKYTITLGISNGNMGSEDIDPSQFK